MEGGEDVMFIEEWLLNKKEKQFLECLKILFFYSESLRKDLVKLLEGVGGHFSSQRLRTMFLLQTILEFVSKWGTENLGMGGPSGCLDCLHRVCVCQFLLLAFAVMTPIQRALTVRTFSEWVKHL